MARAMLGNVPLADWQRARDQLEERIGGTNGPGWLAALNRFLRKEDPWPEGVEDCVPAANASVEAQAGLVLAPDHATWSVWCTLTLGRHRTAAAYREMLRGGGFRMNDLADDVLGRIQFLETETVVPIFRVTGAMLGLGKRRYTIAELFAAAAGRGFKKLPPETGPALRFGYRDQQGEDDVILIGMEPVADSGNDPRVFRLVCDGGTPMLHTIYAGPETQVDHWAVWAFGR